MQSKAMKFHAGSAKRPWLLPLLILSGLGAMAQEVVISEFMADNGSGIQSEFGEHADWIEIHNRGQDPVDLDGWRLTDDVERPSKWVFPPRTIAAGAYEIVWADGRDRRLPGRPLHTNFALAKNGEYLALIRPDGTVATAFTPRFPVQVRDISYGFPAPSQGNDGSLPVYFTNPTPGAPNDIGGSVGPAFVEVTSSLAQPRGDHTDPPVIVTAKLAPTSAEINPNTVRVYFQRMFKTETSSVMRDDGVAPDEVAGDGIYTVLLRISSLSHGEMFRWRFRAQDVEGRTSFAPADPSDPGRDHYYGTVAMDPSLDRSELPVIQEFLQYPSQADGDSGTTGSVYYLGRFYDNVEFDRHGQSSRGFPKKSNNLRFNKGNYFVHSVDPAIKQKGLNLLSNYADKTRFRNTLAWEMVRKSGAPWLYTTPARVQRNAEFHGLQDMMEKGNDRMLERNGMNADGALYKIYNSLDSLSKAEKKTRTDEDMGDLQSLIDHLNPSLPLERRLTYAYDNVDLASLVNYLAIRALFSDRDHGHKNYFVFRDTGRTNEWMPIVWDVDLSFGHEWTEAENYFKDAIVPNAFLSSWQMNNNRLYKIAYESPVIRAMLMRRFRTLMDQMMQPPGTADGWMETRMREIVASIDPDPARSNWTDGDLDFVKWKSWGRGLEPREETEYVISHYNIPRRAFLYDMGNGRPALGGMPIPGEKQSDTPGMIHIVEADYLPASGDQREEYIILKNNTGEDVDISGWELSGGIRHKFVGGTVIPPGDGSPEVNYAGLLHVTKDAIAFRNRSTGPRGGQRRFIQGNYSGQLSARGETVDLRNQDGLLVATYTYPGTPTALQESLRVAEIQYHPRAPSPAELLVMPWLATSDFEYLELVNISDETLDLSGAAFTKGVTYVIPPATILAPGGRLLIAAYPEAFALRYPQVTASVLGPFEGTLDNAGERIRLEDAAGEVVLDFTYSDHSHRITDGTGRSLVLRDPLTPWDEFEQETTWAVSRGSLGNPGEAKFPFALTYENWKWLHFTAEELADPAISGPDADPDGDGSPNFAEYALNTDPFTPDLARTVFAFANENGIRHAGIRFARPTHAIDVEYALEAAVDPAMGWNPSAARWQWVQAGETETEIGILYEEQPAVGSHRFLRLKISQKH